MSKREGSCLVIVSFSSSNTTTFSTSETRSFITRPQSRSIERDNEKTFKSQYFIPCHFCRCQGHIPFQFEVQLMDYIVAHPSKGIFVSCPYRSMLFSGLFAVLTPAGRERGSNKIRHLFGAEWKIKPVENSLANLRNRHTIIWIAFNVLRAQPTD